MASFQEHIEQAKRNLSFLESVNRLQANYWDWQVTVCFYVVVHMINAHIAKKGNMHYRTHKDVESAINPYNKLSPAKVNETVFTAFKTIRNLSRRSRYMINENKEIKRETAHFTYDKHLRKAIINLDKIICYIGSEYKIRFTNIIISCPDFRPSDSFSHFNVNK